MHQQTLSFHTDSDFEGKGGDMSPQPTTNFDMISPLPLTTNCPSLTSSFFSLDSSTMEGADQRDSSVTSYGSNSASPELFFTPSTATTSPTTPMMAALHMANSHGNNVKALPGFPRYQSSVELSHDSEDIHECMWINNMEMQNLGVDMGISFTAGMSDAPGEDDDYQLYNIEHQGLSTTAVNPALTKPIFGDSTGCLPIQVTEIELLPWNNCQLQPPSQTIEPSATFQNVLSSSPGYKMEPSTPLNIQLLPSAILNSSPMSILSPAVVPSQHNVEELSYESIEQAMRFGTSRRHRGTTDRLYRRNYERKKLPGTSAKPKPVSGKSGINCDVVIPINEFPCGYPGCVDKKGDPKRFKRREHMKRHEKTVHQSDKPYKCWVPDCNRAFSRTDNLKSHLRNTHSKKPGVRGNRYVATLDKGSDYYDPEWSGILDKQGYPIM